MLLAAVCMIAPAVFLVSCFNQPPIQAGFIIIAELLLIYAIDARDHEDNQQQQRNHSERA